MRRVFSALVVTAALAAPMAATTSAIAAEPRAASHVVVVRVYDPYRNDYHRWDNREERAYRAYLAQHRRSYVVYRHQRLAERRAYWRWRHEREERLEYRRR